MTKEKKREAGTTLTAKSRTAPQVTAITYTPHAMSGKGQRGAKEGKNVLKNIFYLHMSRKCCIFATNFGIELKKHET